MQSLILENKPKITKNNEDFIDLTTQSVSYQNNPIVIDAIIIDQDIEMRPDLVAKKVYGDDTDWDMILKFNGVSNPFSIGTNNILFIPDLSWMYNSLVNNNIESPDDALRSDYLDATKKPDTDLNRIKYSQLIKQLREKSSINTQFSNYGLPPNISEPGDQEGRIVNNNIIFGDDVTKT